MLWARAERELDRFYREKYKWSQATLNSIDWDPFASTTKEKNFQRRFIPKLVSSWLPTNTVLAKREERLLTCPSCSKEETNDHVFICQSQLALDQKFKRKVVMFLATHGTCPTLAHQISEGLACYIICARQNLPLPPFSTNVHL